jgi:hypothetical protein
MSVHQEYILVQMIPFHTPNIQPNHNNTTITKQNIMPSKKSRDASPLSTDYEETDTSVLEPSDNEFDGVEVENEEWSDEQLMDDARPGRRAKAEERGKK